MEFPIYLTAFVLAGGAFAVMALPWALAGVHRDWTRAAVALTLAAWFILSTILAGLGVYRSSADEVVPAIAVALAVSLVATGMAMALLARLTTGLADAQLQSRLVAIQVWRIVGFAFLAVLALGGLPPLFALPAGVGDVIVGATAPLVAQNLHRQRLAVAWHLIGIADLVVAITLGVTTSQGRAQLFEVTPTSDALLAFPLAIIPTFLVPISLALHLVGLRAVVSGHLGAAQASRP